MNFIKDKNILSLIHFNFRLMYVKDCALAHILDERALGLILIVNNLNKEYPTK